MVPTLVSDSGCTISSQPDPAPNRADASHRQFGPSLIEVAHFSSHKSFLVVVKTILPMPEKEPDHQTQIYETIVKSKERNFVCSNLQFRWVGEKWLQALSPPSRSNGSPPPSLAPRIKVLPSTACCDECKHNNEHDSTIGAHFMEDNVLSFAMT